MICLLLGPEDKVSTLPPKRSYAATNPERSNIPEGSTCLVSVTVETSRRCKLVLLTLVHDTVTQITSAMCPLEDIQKKTNAIQCCCPFGFQG
jgi:hypothetical protein